jgi:hypothetical protein
MQVLRQSGPPETPDDPVKILFRLLLCIPLALPMVAMGGLRAASALATQRPTESEEIPHSGQEAVSCIVSACRRAREAVGSGFLPRVSAVLRAAPRRILAVAADCMCARDRGHCLANGLRAPLLT